MYPTTHDIDQVYQQQILFRESLRKSTAAQRKGWLKSLRNNILRNEQSIKEALYADFRKSPVETDVTEIFATLAELDVIIRNIEKWIKRKKVPSPLFFKSIQAKLQYEPKGNTLIITPWNYPFQLPMVHMMASVAAGNTVILKLSENTPHTNQVVKKIIGQTFETQHVTVIEGEIVETTHLLSLKFDHIHFTGSPAIGKVIMAAASKHLCAVTLELGGKSPAFIDKDINITQVVQNMIWAKFLNAGQTCIAPDYLLVDQEIQAKFEETFRHEITKAFGTDPQHSADLARIINVKQFDRLQRALDELKDSATKWIAGGRTDRDTCYMEPTVVTDTPLDSQIMQEEIFGPILPIVYYDSIHQAFDLVARKEKPLALYIFSRDTQYVDSVLHNTTAGGTSINDAMVHILHPNLPFGGVNNSGIGQSLGFYGFKDFSHERAIADVKFFPMTKFFWFPYTEKTTKMVRWLKKIF